MNNELIMPLGLNRTGNGLSPIESEKTKEGAELYTRPPKGDGTAIAENRISYMKEADPMGTVPLPVTVQGVATGIQEKILVGNYAFLDKLGERLCFERTGTRLYEALIVKYQGSTRKHILPELTRIEQFYLEELKHFQMLAESISKIGGDPTALTPAGAISGSAMIGWIQVITDPRTTFLQSLEIILNLELIDNSGWELLIELAERNNLGDMAVQFQQYLDEEAFHLVTVKQWVQELTLNNEIISPEQNFDIKGGLH